MKILVLCLQLGFVNSLLDFKDSSHERFFYSDFSETSDISEFELSDMSDFERSESESDVDFVSIPDDDQSTGMYANFPTHTMMGKDVSVSADHTGTFTRISSTFLPKEMNISTSVPIHLPTETFDSRNRQQTNKTNILEKATVKMKNNVRNDTTSGVVSFLGDISRFPGIQTKNKQQYIPSEHGRNNDIVSLANFPGILSTDKLKHLPVAQTNEKNNINLAGVESVINTTGISPGILSAEKMNILPFALRKPVRAT